MVSGIEIPMNGLKVVKKLYRDHCKGRFYECFNRGGFTTIGGEESPNSITFLQFHAYYQLMVKIDGRKSRWFNCRFPDQMDSTFKNAVKSLSTPSRKLVK